MPGAVGDVGQQHGHLQNIAEAGARLVENLLHIDEDLLGLGGDIGAADEIAVRPGRGNAGNKQHVAVPDRIGVVADRLAKLSQSEFFAVCRHHAPSQACWSGKSRIQFFLGHAHDFAHRRKILSCHR
jgi:hypothetical protein